MTELHRSARWQRFVKRTRPQIEKALPLPCVDCGRPIHPGERFHVGHIISNQSDPTQILTPEGVGPSHPHCNTSAGSKEMHARRAAAKREDQRLPREGSGW